MPERAPAGADRLVAGFAAALRAAGLAVPVGSVVTFTRALALVGLDDPAAVYWSGRATLLNRPEDVEIYDRVFTSYWVDISAMRISPVRTTPVTLALDEEEGAEEPPPGEDGAKPGDEVQALRWSAVEVLRERDLGGLSAEEWAEAQRLIAALRMTSELRPSRRHRPSGRSGRRRDLPATMRRSMRHGGVPVEWVWSRSVPRPRRTVFLLDVSGSMESYARAMVRFAHAAVSSRRAGRVEVFTIGTRLTRITRELARRDPEAALDAMASSVADWSGGTRLGGALAEFNDRWGMRGMARGAVVVICSDGWDRGDPEVVAAEMGRLARVARRVIWVNPLKASPGYAPLARGMAAALPYVDQFVEGHSVASLEELARRIAGGDREGR